MKKIYFFLCLLALCSCSSDDASWDPVTSVRMTLNGVQRTFEPSTRSVTLENDGTYKLMLTFYSNDGIGDVGEMGLVMRYRKKGHNVIEIMGFSLPGSSHAADLTNQTFDNHVTVNNNKHFTADFTAVFDEAGHASVITNGYINIVYDSPF